MKSWGSPELVVPGLIAVVVSSCLVQNPTCLNLSWLQEHYWYSGARLAWNCGNKWGPSRASSLQTASTNCIPPVVEILLLRQMNSCLPPPPSSLALSSFLSKLGFWLSLPQQKLQLHFSGKLLLNPKSAIKDCWTAVLPSPSESCWQPAFHHLQIFVDCSIFFCHDITSNLYWCMCICMINKFCLFISSLKKKCVRNARRWCSHLQQSLRGRDVSCCGNNWMSSTPKSTWLGGVFLEGVRGQSCVRQISGVAGRIWDQRYC